MFDNSHVCKLPRPQVRAPQIHSMFLVNNRKNISAVTVWLRQNELCAWMVRCRRTLDDEPSVHKLPSQGRRIQTCLCQCQRLPPTLLKDQLTLVLSARQEKSTIAEIEGEPCWRVTDTWEPQRAFSGRSTNSDFHMKPAGTFQREQDIPKSDKRYSRVSILIDKCLWDSQCLPTVRKHRKDQ
jgi:hypothetical protein